MTRYVLRRLALLPLLLFDLLGDRLRGQAPPGDFLTSYMATLASSGSSVSAEQFEALRRDYGLDQPLHVQYWKWMANVLRGNLGLSLEYQRPNTELIGERLVLTVILALFSFVFTWLVAIPIGIYSATHPRSVLDYAITVLTTWAWRRRTSSRAHPHGSPAYLGSAPFLPCRSSSAAVGAARVLNLWRTSGCRRWSWGRRDRTPHP
jgi:ABC-type dipeptide/oligopeptide/nickel transport system permease component